MVKNDSIRPIYGSGTLRVRDRRSALILDGCRLLRALRPELVVIFRGSLESIIRPAMLLDLRLAVVGTAVMARLCCDGSSLLLQHHVVAQGEAEFNRCIETESAAKAAEDPPR